MRRSAAATLIATLLATAWFFSDNGPPEATCAIVDFADLDLSSTQAAAVLFSRISTAAAYVCEPVLDAAQQPYQWRLCVSQAVLRAVAEIDQPEVSRYVAARFDAEHDQWLVDASIAGRRGMVPARRICSICARCTGSQARVSATRV